MKKFAIISSSVPPSNTGQAIILYRLLSEVDPHNYIIITTDRITEKYPSLATKKLSCKYYVLKESLIARKIGYFKYIGLVIKIIVKTILLHRIRKLQDILYREQIEVVIGCSGNIFDLPLSWMVAKKNNIEFIPYYFDYYACNYEYALKLLCLKFEKSFILSAKNLIVPNEHLDQILKKEYSKEGITIIRNSIEDIHYNFKPCLIRDYSQAIKISFTGTIYHANYDSFINLVLAIKKIKNKEVFLHIYSSQSEKRLIRNGICSNNIIHHSAISNNLIAEEVYKDSDILFLPLSFSKIQEIIWSSAPGKFAEYLSSHVPILAHVPENSWVAWYLNFHNCAEVITQPNPDAIIDGINRIVSDYDYRNTIVENALKRAAIDFDINQSRADFYKLLN